MKAEVCAIAVPVMVACLYASLVISDYGNQWNEYLKREKSDSPTRPSFFRSMKLDFLRE